MKIALLPTGRMEWEGLPAALSRLFCGQHEFYCLPTQAEIDSNPSGYPYDGFTSAELGELQAQEPPSSARLLVSRAAQEALGDRRREAADLVLILDDLELANIAQPARVVAVMRRAVEVHLQQQQVQRHYDATAQALRARVSFHLISPMIEAWLFADPAALGRCGVTSPVCFDDSIDPEQFVTTDALYLAADRSHCPELERQSASKLKKNKPKWLGASRAHHPKGYLQWLCIAPEAKTCTSYSETSHGADALKSLDWSLLLQRDVGHFRFLRALIEDLEESLGASMFGPVAPALPRPTSRPHAPQDAILRNI